MNNQVFDTGNLTPAQRALVNAALTACSFDWALLLPGLNAGNQWSRPGRTSIPVTCRDLSQFAGSAASDDYHEIGVDEMGRVVDEDAPDNAAAVLGLFWFDGRVEVEQGLVNNPALFQEVFLSEGAHAADFYFLWPENLRKPLYDIYHPNGPDQHGHFEGPYFDTVGEAFMGGFVYATTGKPPTLLGFSHVTTQAIAQRIKTLLRIEVAPPIPPPPLPPLPPPPDIFDITQVSDAAFDAEFNRRYGFFKDLSIDLGFTKSDRRWQGRFQS